MENALPDIPRYFTALAEWLACMIMILTLRQRCEGWKLFVAAGAALVFQVVFLVLTGGCPEIFWLLCMIVAFLAMVILLFLCCKVTWRGAVYMGMLAFLFAEFMASIEWQLFCWAVLYEPNKFVMMALIYGISCLIFWKMMHHHRPKDEIFDVNDREMWNSVLLTGLTFAIGNISFVTQGTPFSSSQGPGAATIRTLADLSGVAMLYARYIERQEMHAREELKMMQSVMEYQYQQYQLSEESVNLINYKYHDLKHQLEVLRAEEDAGVRNAFLERMQEEIRQYEQQNKTGNKVLDTLLTSKSMICEKDGISLNCVADGARLSFIDPVDLSGIIGNALDNAIEYERTVEDQEKRLIDIAIFAQEKLLIMRFANYFDGELRRSGNTLLTTKGEDGFRGYGVKSIRYTVKKYGGAVSIDAEDQWFELKILIPFPTQKSMQKI